MARISVDVSEINTLAVDLGQAPAKVGDRARAVMRKTTLDIEADAKRFAPVDTGNLRNSIGHSDLRALTQTGTLETEIGPTASYGKFVEFGTSRMAPHAFMGPAFDRAQPGFIAAMEQIAGDVL